MRRVAIAGILAMNPSVLVLDEPTAGLDPKARIDMMRLFETIHASGVTTILVTHLMDDVADYADTMYVLEKGRIVKSGKPQDLFQDVAFMTAHQLGVPKATRFALLLRERGQYFEHLPITRAALVEMIKEAANHG